MKMKCTTLLKGIVVLMVILLMASQSVVAAPPEGEVKTVGETFGNMVPNPSLDMNAANDWLQLLYDPLVGMSPDGKFSPDLGLANKWEMSRDGLTWTFYLRKGVKFHDGVEVTAKDVKFSIEQCMLPGVSSAEAPFLRKDIKSIEVKNPHTVVFHCKRPAIFLDGLLGGVCGMIIPKDYYERIGRDEFAKRPIGSGPYKFHSLVPGSYVRLEANDGKHWRDGIPKYKYMTYLIIPEENTRLAMLRTGEADIARISRNSVKDALNANLNVITKESGGIVIFHPNMQWTSPAFSDIRFRKALNLAIDKEAIIKNIFAGMANPVAMYPGSDIATFGGDRTLKPYPYDPQEAKRLIKEGGWEGYEFTLVSYARAGFPELPLITEALAGYWQQIGLKVRMHLSEYNVWRETWRNRKTHNTVHGYDALGSPDVATLYSKFKEKWYFKESRSTVNIPELNDRYDRIENCIDVGEISKLMGEIYRYAYDQYLMIPICEFFGKIATTKRIPKWDTGVRKNDRNYNDLIKQR